MHQHWSLGGGLLYLGAFCIDWVVFVVVLRNAAVQTTGRFLACNFLLADIWNLFIGGGFSQTMPVMASQQVLDRFWTLPFMAPVFTYLAAPVLLVNCLAYLKSPACYPLFEKRLMKIGMVFVWALGLCWCGLVLTGHVIGVDNRQPFSHFLFILHTLSFTFCAFLSVDIAFHKWSSRRKVWNFSQPPPALYSAASNVIQCSPEAVTPPVNMDITPYLVLVLCSSVTMTLPLQLSQLLLPHHTQLTHLASLATPVCSVISGTLFVTLQADLRQQLFHC